MPSFSQRNLRLVISGRYLHVSETKFQDKFASLLQVNSPNSWDKFQICYTDMYLIRFNYRIWRYFACFCEFHRISQIYIWTENKSNKQSKLSCRLGRGKGGAARSPPQTNAWVALLVNFFFVIFPTAEPGSKLPWKSNSSCKITKANSYHTSIFVMSCILASHVYYFCHWEVISWGAWIYHHTTLGKGKTQNKN